MTAQNNGLKAVRGTSVLSDASLCGFGQSVSVGKLLDSWHVSREEQVGAQMLNDSEALALGKALSLLVEQRGIGSIGKRDYELLVFHHLSSSVAMRGDWNYVLANKLKVTESRIKTLRLESSIRHQPANHKAVLGKIVQRVVDALSRPDFADGLVAITLEDPVERREFEHAVKLARHTVEYGINREILRISPLALFEIILANVERPEQRFKEIVQTHIQAKSEQARVLDAALTFRQKLNKFGERVTGNEGAVAILTAAAGFL